MFCKKATGQPGIMMNVLTLGYNIIHIPLEYDTIYIIFTGCIIRIEHYIFIYIQGVSMVQRSFRLTKKPIVFENELLILNF